MDSILGKKGRQAPRASFRVLRKPAWDEMGCSYEIVDRTGRVVQTESDLDDALAAAAYMNEQLHGRKAA